MTSPQLSEIEAKAHVRREKMSDLDYAKEQLEIGDYEICKALAKSQYRRAIFIANEVIRLCTPFKESLPKYDESHWERRLYVARKNIRK